MEKQTGSRLTALSVLLSRAQLAARLGQQYDNARDIYEALGYDLELSYEKYAAQYERQSIAKAIINRPVDATWRGEFGIVESDDDEETALEREWKALDKRLGLKSRFVRLDKMACLGKYAVLLLGLDDVANRDAFQQPVKAGARKLLYVKPYAEDDIAIHAWENNTNDEHYGLPRIYKITFTSADGNQTEQVLVHHTRIIHVAGELLKSEVEGVPVLQSVFNRLKDLEKLVGGSAEMFWRGARPGYQGKLDPDYQLTPEMREDLQDQIDEFEHNLRRILINEGVSLEGLPPQVSDPGPHLDVQIQMISAVTGIPKRILTGSERGELASSEDRNNWLDLIQSRREEYAEPQIVRPFTDRCIKFGILPQAEEYGVKWQDLYAMSDKQKAEVGQIRAMAIKEYSTSPTAEDLMPFDAFLEFCLGFSDDQIELIREMKEAAIREEEEDMRRAEEEALAGAE